MNAFTETDLIRPFFSTSFRYAYLSIFFCLAFWKSSVPFSNGIVTSTTKMSLPFLITRSGLSTVFDPGMVWLAIRMTAPVCLSVRDVQLSRQLLNHLKTDFLRQF